MYDVLRYWETADAVPDRPAVMVDFARIWQAADKVVYSKSLASVSTKRTRIERSFDPQAVRQMKESAPGDLTIGGPELAAQAIEAGLVDEFQIYLTPIILGGGKHWLPKDARVKLELLDERRFRNGTVFLRYRTL